MKNIKSIDVNEMYSSIVAKCWSSPEFKNELIRDPQTALLREFGCHIVIPEGKKLVIKDQTDPKYVTINIPAAPQIEDLVLTDEELELVSGGSTYLCVAGLAFAGGLLFAYGDDKGWW